MAIVPVLAHHSQGHSAEPATGQMARGRGRTSALLRASSVSHHSGVVPFTTIGRRDE